MKLCPQCQRPVKRKVLTHCSMACYTEARKKSVQVQCTKCGVDFVIRPFEQARAKRHYCPECRERWRNKKPIDKKPTGYMLNCFFCNAPIYRPKWRANRYLFSFCSKDCRKAGWKELMRAHEGLFGSPKDREKKNAS